MLDTIVSLYISGLNLHSDCFHNFSVSPLTALFMCLDTIIMVRSTFHLQLALALSWQETGAEMPTQQRGTMNSAQNN